LRIAESIAAKLDAERRRFRTLGGDADDVPAAIVDRENACQFLVGVNVVSAPPAG
jgi:hypothetical protein